MMTYKERLDSVRQECKDYIEMYMEEFEEFTCPARLFEHFPNENCYELSHMRIEDGKVYVLGTETFGMEREFDLNELYVDNMAEICDAMVKEKRWKQ